MESSEERGQCRRFIQKNKPIQSIQKNVLGIIDRAYCKQYVLEMKVAKQEDQTPRCLVLGCWAGPQYADIPFFLNNDRPQLNWEAFAQNEFWWTQRTHYKDYLKNINSGAELSSWGRRDWQDWGKQKHAGAVRSSSFQLPGLQAQSIYLPVQNRGPSLTLSLWESVVWLPESECLVFLTF